MFTNYIEIEKYKRKKKKAFDYRNTFFSSKIRPTPNSGEHMYATKTPANTSFSSGFHVLFRIKIN